MTHVQINTTTGKPELTEKAEKQLADILHGLSPIAVNAEVVALSPLLASWVHRAVVDVRRQGWKMQSPQDVTQERDRIDGLARQLSFIYRDGAGHDITYFPTQLHDLIREGWYARDNMTFDRRPNDDEFIEYHHLRMNNNHGMTREAPRGEQAMAPEQEAQVNALFYRIMRKPGAPVEVGSNGCRLVGCTYTGPHSHGTDTDTGHNGMDDATTENDSNKGKVDRSYEADLMVRIRSGLMDAGFPMDSEVGDSIVAKVAARLLAE